jgi:hypothetical protein
MGNQTKKETIEEVAIKKYGTGYHSVDIKHAFIDGAKWMEEQAKEMEKERMVDFAKYCLNNAKYLNFNKALFNVEEYYQIFKSK